MMKIFKKRGRCGLFPAPIILLALLYFKPYDPDVANAERVSVTDFSGGLNTKVSANQLPLNQCSNVYNVLFDEKPGSLVSVGGYSQITSENAREIFYFQKSNGEKYLLKHYQGTLQFSQDNGETWTNVITGLSWQGTRLRAAIYDNKIWFTTGFDDVFYFDGQTHDGNYYESFDFIPKGKYILSAKNRLWIANTWDNASAVYYTNVLADPTDEESWPEKNINIVGNQDGDIVTGLALYRNQVIVTKRRSIYYFLGDLRETWRLNRVNSNYGSLQQESMFIDKGLLKFLSYDGIKAYNGSIVIDIDMNIENVVDATNNLNGENSYLQISGSDDFDDGTNTNTDYGEEELKLKSYEHSWDYSNFDEGTNSNTRFINNTIELSTSTKEEVKHVTLGGLTYDFILEASNGAVFWNSDGGGWIEEDSGQAGSSLYPMANLRYENAFNIYDVDSDSTTSYAKQNKVFYGTVSGKDHNTFNYTGTPKINFYISSFGSGKKLSKIRYTGGLSIDRFYFNFLQYDLWDARSAAEINVFLKAQVRWYYLDGSQRNTYTTLAKRRLRKLCKDIDVGQNIDSDTTYYKYYSGNTINFNNPIKSKDVHKVELMFYADATSNEELREKGDYFSMTYLLSATPIYDISVYEITTKEVYQTSGYALLVSTNIGGTSQDLIFGKITISDFTDYDTYGTTATYAVRTSTDTSSPLAWSAWYEVKDGDTMSVQGVPDGKYIQCVSSFSATLSTYTPVFYGIDIEALNSTGTWTDTIRNVGKVAGDWSYFVAETDLKGQTANFWVRLGTGTTDVSNTVWSSISSGDLISGTTNETYIQLRATLQTTNGSINPKILSLNAVYAPEQSPVYSDARSYKDRYMIALSTSGDTDNSSWYIHDKNNAWTRLYIDVDGSCYYGKDLYFSNENGIFKMFDGTTFNGSAISSKWEKIFPFDYSFDSRINYLYTIGQQKSGGALDITYKMENTTNTYTASDIDAGTAGNRFRHLQQNAFNKSPVADWTVIYESTSAFEVNVLQLWPEIDLEHKPQ